MTHPISFSDKQLTRPLQLMDPLHPRDRAMRVQQAPAPSTNVDILAAGVDAGAAGSIGSGGLAGRRGSTNKS
jgi:hypothetical protein